MLFILLPIDAITLNHDFEGHSGTVETDKPSGDGGNVEQLTFHDDRDSSADWSPDGSQIVFRRRIAGNSDIWVVNADGSWQPSK